MLLKPQSFAVLCNEVDIYRFFQPNDPQRVPMKPFLLELLICFRVRTTISNHFELIRSCYIKADRHIKPGTVRLAWGWGETKPSANHNQLTDDHRRNPVTGTPGNRSFMCRIRKSMNLPI